MQIHTLSKTHVVLSNQVNLVLDGNSLADSIRPYYAALPPFLTSGVICPEVAIPGQSWMDMIINASDIDAALAGNYLHRVLFLWETTNQLNSGSSVQVCINTALRYIDERRALYPDLRIAVFETLPRAGINTTYNNLLQFNQKLQTVDAFFYNNQSKYDLQFFSLRNGTPYDFRRFDQQEFIDAQDYFIETANNQTHMTDAGKSIIALKFCAAANQIKSGF